MGIRNIVNEGDEILTKKSKPVTQFDKKLHNLLDDMADTLKKQNGVGLACPQVGYLKRAAIIDIGAIQGSDENLGMLEMINPQLSNFDGEQRDIEGCLSCPNVWGYVKRPFSCTLKAQNRHGEWYTINLEGIGARCAMHEYDHLDGLLFRRLVDEYVEKDEED